MRTTVAGLLLWLALGGKAFSQQMIGNCPVLPANNIWNTPVDRLPVLPNSTAMVNTIGASTGFHADFGAGTWNGGPIGIPFVNVGNGEAQWPASFRWWDESDPGPYAVPLTAPIEGGSNSTGDRHAIAIDTDNCRLYELYRAFPQASSWTADSGAIFDLRSNALRPIPWTSADAAGLPIMPGLVTYEEAQSGEIRHAIRFTAPQTRKAYVWPARHYASTLTGTEYPRMGERFRLKASFNIAGYPPEVQVILRAMKKYGIILADNGSSWYLSGKPDSRWNNSNLHALGQLTGTSFEAVDATVLMIDPNSGRASQHPGTDADFDADARADRTVFRPGTGAWYSSRSGGATTMTMWGTSTDIDVSGDFDGDGKADLTVFRLAPAAAATWYIVSSQTGTVQVVPWGQSGDVPIAADFDGDGKDDQATFRPGTGTWYINRSSGGTSTTAWGAAGDQPLVCDWDGDAVVDPTIYRPASRTWYVLKSTGGSAVVVWGMPNDVPLAGDWDGDGKGDIAVFRPTTGEWLVRGSAGSTLAVTWGANGDIPVSGDWDGDGRSDFTVWRPGSAMWFTRFSGGGTAAVLWGATGDRPVGRMPGS